MTSRRKTAGRTEKTQLLVVGGGPVGLCAALSAARRGLDVTVLEQNFRGYARGHATILHPSSLRLLAELGLSQQVLGAGAALNAVRLHVADAPALAVELPLPALTVPQTALEDILLKALHRETVKIKQSCELTELEQGEDSVLATVRRRKLVRLGSPAQYSEWQPIDSSLIEARFVIGADGYESFVRPALGIEHVPAGPTEAFAMFEGRAVEGSAVLELGFDPDFVCAVYPLTDGRTRWGFQVSPALDRQPDTELLRALLAERAPWLEGSPVSVDWSSVTHFERRFARRFGDRRVWLAGDAAHVTSPFGGHSLNGGLLEAFQLVDQMADCVFAGKALDGLAEWAKDREREWQVLTGLHATVHAGPDAPSWLPAQAARIIPALPASGRDLHHMLRELGLIVR